MIDFTLLRTDIFQFCDGIVKYHVFYLYEFYIFRTKYIMMQFDRVEKKIER